MSRRIAVLFGLATAAALWSTPAWAPFHLIAIDQVFFGTESCPNVQYVQLRLLSPGMIFVMGQHVKTQTADGSNADDFGVFANDIALTNGDNGATILMGSEEAQTELGIQLDAVVPGILPLPAGRVCFGAFPGASGPPVDCVAYGDYTGANAGGGDPAPAPQLGMALVRQSNTSNDATDFVLGAAAPRNNAGATGALSACGGAESTPTPTETGVVTLPTPTARVSPAPPLGCAGDCNLNSVVTVNELIVGVNIVLGSASLDQCAAYLATPQINDLIAAMNALLNGCPATPEPTIAVITPTRTPGGPLGVRRFSINPASSPLVAVLGPGASFPSFGFEGFLELSAGAPDPQTGVALIDITDASQYIAVDVPLGGTALCIHVLRDQLPRLQAGLIACNGGYPLGLELVQDHALGVVGACKGGINDGLSCTGDGECGDGECFSASDCSAGEGTVEGAEQAHPGVCNGPLAGGPLAGNSGPGTVLISPDPTFHITQGLPAEIVLEQSTPCGDEGSVGFSTVLAFTSDRAVGRILHVNNSGGELSNERMGESFSCAEWEREDGPGTLVLNVAQLDTGAAGPSPVDLITTFVFDD